MKTKLQQLAEEFSNEVLKQIELGNFEKEGSDFTELYKISIDGISLSLFKYKEITILPGFKIEVKKKRGEDIINKLKPDTDEENRKRIAELKAELAELEKHVV